MANFRQIHVSIWKDEWFLDLEPAEKLLFVYLFSNEMTSISGLYKLPLKVIQFETGLERNFILDTLDKFSRQDKIHYEDGVVWVVNMRRYHETKSIKVKTRIDSDIALIPDCPLKIRYLYGMDTAPQLKEKEEEKEKENGRSGGIYAAYEANIGALTPLIADELKDMESDYSEDWILEAIGIAVQSEKRNLNYVRGILRRWKANGKSNTKQGASYERPASEVY